MKINIIQDNYNEIVEIALKSTSISNLCKNLGHSHNTININKLKFLIQENNFDTNIFLNQKNNKSECPFNDKEKLSTIIIESFCYSDVLRKYNKKTGSGNFELLKKYIEMFNIDISHFNPNKRFEKSYYKIKNNEDLFTMNTDTKAVRRRILKEDLIPYKCENQECGNDGTWFGQVITLQLDHINGNNKDNRLENLRFLCPNCHCMTPTWGNKRSYKKMQHEAVGSNKLRILFNEDKENFLVKVIKNCKNSTQILTYFNLPHSSRHYNKLEEILNENKEHINVKNFLTGQKKQFVWLPIEDIIEKLQYNSFLKVAKELGCSDNGLRKYLVKNGVDIKNIKKKYE